MAPEANLSSIPRVSYPDRKNKLSISAINAQDPEVWRPLSEE